MKRTSRPWLTRIFSPFPKNHRPANSSAPSFSWREFGRHYRKAFLWILLLTALVHVMEISGVLKGFEMASLDAFLRLNERKMSEHVVVVEITNEDYRDPQLFDDQSPLNSETLVNLVSAIQKYRPAVVGVDIDTDSKNWSKANSDLLAGVLPAAAAGQNSSPIPVVWAVIPYKNDEPLTLTPVLAGRLRDPCYIGIPRFPVDSDGLVRRYKADFSVQAPQESCREDLSGGSNNLEKGERGQKPHQAGTTLWSFARATIHHACKDSIVNCSRLQKAEHHPVIFNFFGDRYRFPIIQSHEFVGPTAKSLEDNKDIQDRRRNLLKDKIVLIGGSYNAARDVYLTPLGEMAGVELIALAIESDFGGGIREMDKWLEKLADVLVGSLIVFVYFYYRRRPRFAFVISLAGVPVLAIVASFLLFRTLAYWFNFMPVIIGMVMHQMLELSESCADLEKGIQHLELQLHKSRKSDSREDVGTATAVENPGPPSAKQPPPKS